MVFSMSLIVQGEAMAWLLRMLPPHTCKGNEPKSANSAFKRTKSSGGRIVKDLRPLVVDAALIVVSNFAFTISELELKSRMLSALYIPPSLCQKKNRPRLQEVGNLLVSDSHCYDYHRPKLLRYRYRRCHSRHPWLKHCALQTTYKLQVLVY